jgi:hypothetical protein
MKDCSKWFSLTVSLENNAHLKVYISEFKAIVNQAVMFDFTIVSVILDTMKPVNLFKYHKHWIHLCAYVQLYNVKLPSQHQF